MQSSSRTRPHGCTRGFRFIRSPRRVLPSDAALPGRVPLHGHGPARGALRPDGRDLPGCRAGSGVHQPRQPVFQRRRDLVVVVGDGAVVRPLAVRRGERHGFARRCPSAAILPLQLRSRGSLDRATLEAECLREPRYARALGPIGAQSSLKALSDHRHRFTRSFLTTSVCPAWPRFRTATSYIRTRDGISQGPAIRSENLFNAALGRLPRSERCQP